MPWNEADQRAARTIASGWQKPAKRQVRFRDVLAALGLTSSPLDLTSREPEGVRPDYGLTGAGLSARRRYPGEFLPGEATAADVQGALWNIVESAGVENLPGIGPHKMPQRAPGRVRPGHEAEFKEWFGQSKAVDAQGKPLTLYHGSNRRIENFDPGQAHSTTGNVAANLGHFFTPSPEEAATYANLASTGKLMGPPGEGANVTPVHLSMQRPYRMSFNEFDELSMGPFRGTQTEAQARDAALKFRADLMAEGYDGIIAGRPTERGRNPEYIVFDPAQIKSATGNRGTYSRASKDTRD